MQHASSQGLPQHRGGAQCSSSRPSAIRLVPAVRSPLCIVSGDHRAESLARWSPRRHIGSAAGTFKAQDSLRTGCSYRRPAAAVASRCEGALRISCRIQKRGGRRPAPGKELRRRPPLLPKGCCCCCASGSWQFILGHRQEMISAGMQENIPCQ